MNSVFNIKANLTFTFVKIKQKKLPRLNAKAWSKSHKLINLRDVNNNISGEVSSVENKCFILYYPTHNKVLKIILYCSVIPV